MVQPSEKDDEAAVLDLMKRLYEMLCYACDTYIFSTDDPFRSTGITQENTYDIVISKKFSHGKNAESINFAIELIINNSLDRETLYSELMLELMKYLDIADLKIIAIQQCKLLKERLDREKQVTYKKTRNSAASDYKWKRKINNLVEMIFRFNIELVEYNEAINYLNENYQERNREIVLFVLLSLLFKNDLKDQWVKEYERAISDSIEPRESLKKAYNYVRENDVLPKYIF